MSSPFLAHLRVRPALLGMVPGMVAATLTLVAALSATVHAAEVPLTLAQAQRLAVERSRQLSAKDRINSGDQNRRRTGFGSPHHD